MGLAEFLHIVIVSILVLIPTWRIVSRTGYNPFLSILVLIPLVGPLIVLFVLAFGDWPVKRN
ncbi:MAG: hypothetical protein GY874_15035 [Desulfobacteraceae bacterium]|nr:hypothetical protein [Desulfobacteraceae bacterium]